LQGQGRSHLPRQELTFFVDFQLDSSNFYSGKERFSFFQDMTVAELKAAVLAYAKLDLRPETI